MNRNNRKKLAEETLKIIERGYFESPDKEAILFGKEQKVAEEKTKVYSPEESDALIQNYEAQKSENSAFIEVTNESTLEAASRLISNGKSDVICLNFASAKNPGGGFLGGSQAQEESLARSTGLYPCLLTASAYYETNRNSKSGFYTDYMIYSPNVPMFRNDEGDTLNELRLVSFITAPAVNAGALGKKTNKRARERFENATSDQNRGLLGEIESTMKRRIEKVLTIALANGHQTIVLGAWGCGVFRNEPKDIAKYFREVIDEKFLYAFRHITFAIYSSSKHFIVSFQTEFGK